MGNVRLKKRLKRKNTKGRRVFYWPRAISHNKNLEAGAFVHCVEDAIGINPKLVRVARVEDIAQYKSYDTFVVLLEDLTE